jgi:NitT/TauT family transport system substrate-binding protein
MTQADPFRLTRRGLLGGLSAIGAAPALAQTAARPRRVDFAVGTQVLNVTYPYLMMPIALGWDRQAGLEMNMMTVAGSLQIVQMMAAGTVQFAQMNTASIITANVMQNIPVRAIMQNGVIDWALATLDNSPITAPAQFKGKLIGVASLASGGIAFLKSYLRSQGLNPDTDVTLVPVGAGAPALEALRSGRVQGLMYWGAMLSAFENFGAKLRYFRAQEWLTLPDFCMVTLQTTIDRDLPLVEAVARNGARASALTIAGPDCVRRLHWKRWPETKVSGAPDEATAVQWDMNNLSAQIFAMKSALEAGGGKLWGRMTPEGFGRMQDILFDTGVINRKIDPASFVIQAPGFFERINDFDQAATTALAQSCPA